MSLRVYNTLTRQKDLFDPVRPGKVGMYLCGPTVYKAPHIGHLVGPVIFDAIKRYLTFKGFEVTWVVNITDVDDKLIDAAARKGTEMKTLAELHTKDYFEVLDLMGIDTIDRFPKASEHIAEIIALCSKLIENGGAYAADGNVWFDVTKDVDYGKLSNRRVEDQQGERETKGEGKRHPADFALWKAAKPGEPAWASPWGSGRPGWHIECSAMSMKYLGPTFDIHGGGLDLMFPHHENELAQSESCTGQTFARYWLHNGLTKLRTKAAGGQWQAQDIHESEGNAAAVRVKDLVGLHGAEVLRYLLLSTHYRSPIEYSDEALVNSKKALSVFHRLFERTQRITGHSVTERSSDMDVAATALLEGQFSAFAKAILSLKMKLLEMMDDDFNTAGAIAVLHEMAGEINAFIERNEVERSKAVDASACVSAAVQSLRSLGSILGLFNPKLVTPSAVGEQQAGLVDQLMKLMIEMRNDARKTKNFALADQIRKGLIAMGITLEDRPDGTGWRKE